MFASLKQGHWPVFLISILSSLTNLFLPIALVRILTPHDVGVYKIFFLYAHSITFLSLAGGPLYSVYYWIGKKEDAHEIIEQAWLLSFLLSLVSAVIGLMFSLQISHFIAISTEQTILLLLSAITSAPGAFYGEYLIAKGKGISGSLFNSGFDILKAFIIIAVVWHSRHINAAFYSYTILFALKLIIACIWGRNEKILNFKIDWSKIKLVWRYCAPLSFAGALGFFFERIDMILLSSQLSTDHFAFYSMGCLLVPPLYLLEMSVSKVMIPKLSAAYHYQEFKQMVKAYKKAQEDIAHLMIPSVFGLIIFARPIIEILFTKTYIESANYLQFYALTYLSYIFPHDAMARSTGQTRWVLKLYLIMTPLSIVFVYLFAGLYGPMGALISSMCFMFLPKIPGLLFATKITQHKLRELIEWKSLSIYTAINLMLLIFCYGTKPFFETEKTWFLIIAPLYAVIYLCLTKLVAQTKPVTAWEENYEV